MDPLIRFLILLNVIPVIALIIIAIARDLSEFIRKKMGLLPPSPPPSPPRVSSSSPGSVVWMIRARAAAAAAAAAAGAADGGNLPDNSVYGLALDGAAGAGGGSGGFNSSFDPNSMHPNAMSMGVGVGQSMIFDDPLGSLPYGSMHGATSMGNPCDGVAAPVATALGSHRGPPGSLRHANQGAAGGESFTFPPSPSGNGGVAGQFGGSGGPASSSTATATTASMAFRGYGGRSR